MPDIEQILKAGRDAFEREDYDDALKLWQPLAEQGNAKAQASLGWMYFYFKSKVQDYAKAAQWYQKAAEQGDTNSQFNLGAIYREGSAGIAQDYSEALKWFSQGADHDNGMCQLALGQMYENGEGVTKDLVQACKWLRLGISNCRPDFHFAVKARERLAELEKEMSPAQIAEAERLATESKRSK